MLTFAGLLVALTFGVAGLRKTVRLRAFVDTLAIIGVRRQLLWLTALSVVGVELLIALSIVAGLRWSLPLLAGAALLIVFTVAMWRHATEYNALPCACFGGSSIAGYGLIARNAILSGYAVGAAFADPISSEPWRASQFMPVLVQAGAVALVPILGAAAARSWQEASFLVGVEARDGFVESRGDFKG